MRIATIIGVRPQFIKAAVVSRLLRTAGIEERLIHTGQHYDPAMSDVFFQELQLAPPAHHLNIGSSSHGEQTAAMLRSLEAVLQRERPDLALVYGDTNSTLAGALAAAKLGIPIAHVEAGLRSHDRSMPEEINRIVTDHLSHWFFAPTRTAVHNLAREGITARVHLVGDVMYDAWLGHSAHASRRVPALERLGLGDQPFVLVTMHRAGNTDDLRRFGNLWQALDQLARDFPVVFPLHPRTRQVIQRQQLSVRDSLHLVDPVGYREMLALGGRARLIVTDSGGVQKEAYWSAVPCLTLRDNTEWAETIETGWNRLVAPETLLDAAHQAWHAPRPLARPPVFGTGDAGEQIVRYLRTAQSPARRQAC